MLATLLTVASLLWTAPTLNTDGTPITAALTYNVYCGPMMGALTQVQSGLTVTTATITPAMSEFCAVTAVAGGSESVQSSAVQVTVPTTPGPPGLAPVVQPVVVGANVAPAFKFANGVRGGIVGFAPINQSCTGSPVFTWRNFKWYTAQANQVQWWGSAPTSAVVPCK